MNSAFVDCESLICCHHEPSSRPSWIVPKAPRLCNAVQGWQKVGVCLHPCTYDVGQIKQGLRGTEITI